MKKIVLITPPYHCGVLESSGNWLPLAFVYLAGSLRDAGYEVEIYDAMTKFHNYSDIEDYLKKVQPDIVATTGFTAMINDAIKVLDLAKKVNPATITLLGGIHATFMWQEILEKHYQEIDFIIRGEGEETIVELMDVLEGKRDLYSLKGIAFWENSKVVATEKRPLIQDLDKLSLAWDLINWKDYFFRTKPNSVFAVTSSSRGCTQKCSFCSQQLFWEGKWRARSPENFIKELEYLNSKFGVDTVMITDEVPTFDRARWEKILDLLIEKDLGIELMMETRVDDILRDEDIIHRYRKAGIVHIYVGVESASQETLDRFNKNIKLEDSKRAIDIINSADIISETAFVLGMPDETPLSIKRTLELAKHYNPDMAFFMAIAPWPYSDIYKELEPYVEEFDYSKYNLVEPIVKPVNMTREEVKKELFNAFKVFYMEKLTNLSNLSEFKRNYMVAVTHLLTHDSYLADQMKGMGEMPKAIKEYLGTLKNLKINSGNK